MRRLCAFFLALALFTLISGGFFYLISIANQTTDFSSFYGSPVNFISPMYVRNNMTDDTILLLGSSELATANVAGGIFSHPQHLFFDNGYKFNTQLLGSGHRQSLWHTIAVGALDQNITKRKLALIVSFQWFAPDGITKEAFRSRFNPLYFVEFLKNPRLSQNIKKRVVNKVDRMMADDERYLSLMPFIELETQTNVPIFKKIDGRIHSFLYELKEIYKNFKFRNARANEHTKIEVRSNHCSNINWLQLWEKAISEGNAKCTNNTFGIYDEYFNKYVKETFSKGPVKPYDADYNVSAEYNDLRLFLETCIDLNIEPLIIITPVNGPWYDFAGSKPKDRNVYYNNIKNICVENKVEYLDLSCYEYEKYFLCDIMHLGWKGWLKIDEALCNFYYKQ